ncbi:uncharacterized protein EV422DRAFT_306179 [Fimicolochytrium jonesii]|uniref:uncharacterized protein n=1 Tax=Fimicolochytrium jonesii TaxID=1396493 RepID=UPI0022FE9C5D|nr:uncharacterized protein EV422DRAFT_306179 [Fimicolochytrium jonesii]KAI8824089.1 hypothetical protein EV422DRAFT_306179 [Fimicolochytrium jonesii]
MIQPRNSHPPSAHHSVHQTPLSSPAMPQPLMRMKVESVSFPGFHIKRETIAEPISPIKSPHEKIPMLPSSVESSMAMEDVRFSPSRGQYGLSTDHEAYDNLTRRLSFPNHPMNLPPPSPSHVQRVPTDPYRHSASFNLPTPSPSHGHVPMDAYRYYGWGHARGYPPVPHNGYPVHPTHIERPHEPWQPHADQWQRSGEQWQRPGEHFQPGNTLPPISCLFQQSIYDGSAPMSMSDNSSGFPPYPIYTRTQHYQQAI